eukprot:5102111-Lingulodinium_polyedra.AAC.1
MFCLQQPLAVYFAPLHRVPVVTEGSGQSSSLPGEDFIEDWKHHFEIEMMTYLPWFKLLWVPNEDLYLQRGLVHVGGGQVCSSEDSMLLKAYMDTLERPQKEQTE